MLSDIREEDLSPKEKIMIRYIIEAIGPEANQLHCERRTDNYLSIVGPEYSDDFCRIKAGSRSLWMSLDLWYRGVDNDPRLSFVKNKKQRHWKIPLTSPADISMYADLIRLSSQSVLSK